MGKRRRNKVKSQTSTKKVKIYNKVVELLVELLKVLEEGFSYSEEDFYYSQGAFDVFKKFYEFGLICKQEIFKELSETEQVCKIKDLLIENSGKIEKFVRIFPFIILEDIYGPKTICILRSGVQFLFDLWGKLDFNGKDKKTLKELFDPTNRRIEFIDKGLKRWLKREKNHIKDKPDDIVKLHPKWWDVEGTLP
jgi:hypothetical protein